MILKQKRFGLKSLLLGGYCALNLGKKSLRRYSLIGNVIGRQGWFGKEPRFSRPH
jgi:hypothetical protein